MKIRNYESIKSAINHFDNLAQNDGKNLVIFPQKTEKTTVDRMQEFFKIADGNPEWNV